MPLAAAARRQDGALSKSAGGATTCRREALRHADLGARPAIAGAGDIVGPRQRRRQSETSKALQFVTLRPVCVSGGRPRARTIAAFDYLSPGDWRPSADLARETAISILGQRFITTVRPASWAIFSASALIMATVFVSSGPAILLHTPRARCRAGGLAENVHHVTGANILQQATFWPNISLPTMPGLTGMTL